jgi:hypothetical protein
MLSLWLEELQDPFSIKLSPKLCKQKLAVLLPKSLDALDLF